MPNSELSGSLTQLLLDNQMIVPEELDERGEVIAQWEKSVKSETGFFPDYQSDSAMQFQLLVLL